MIKKLENVNEIKDKNEIKDFIKKVSPFTETNQRLLYLIDNFLDENMQPVLIVSLNETSIDPVTKVNSIKHFMAWTVGTTVYAGTEFISEPELTNGLNLTKYGQSAV